jgi:hypothetical protein
LQGLKYKIPLGVKTFLSRRKNISPEEVKLFLRRIKTIPSKNKNYSFEEEKLFLDTSGTHYI